MGHYFQFIKLQLNKLLLLEIIYLHTHISVKETAPYGFNFCTPLQISKRFKSHWNGSDVAAYLSAAEKATFSYVFKAILVSQIDQDGSSSKTNMGYGLLETMRHWLHLLDDM